jgi:hypothetical protein
MVNFLLINNCVYATYSAKKVDAGKQSVRSIPHSEPSFLHVGTIWLGTVLQTAAEAHRLDPRERQALPRDHPNTARRLGL